MKLNEVRAIAKSRNIKLGNSSKTKLIKAIQTDEGNFDCYATAYNGECDQMNCLWREDCFDAASPD